MNTVGEVTDASRPDAGIGTYNEKTLHRVLKYFFEPDDSYHEIPVGDHIADIKRENRIIEIQTSALSTIRKRLDFFLRSYGVELVYPIVGRKNLVWIDPESGNAAAPVPVRKIWKAVSVLPELGRLGELFYDPNLTVKCVILEATEYRLRDGWGSGGKRGAHRVDRVPTDLLDIETVASPDDVRRLLPFEQNAEFTSKEFAKACGFSHKSTRDISMALRFLTESGIVEKCAKKGNAVIYRVT